MAKQQPTPRSTSPPKASKDDSPTPMFTVHDPDYAFQAIGHIGTVLSAYTPEDETEFVAETVRGIGFLLENLADAGAKSLPCGRKGTV